MKKITEHTNGTHIYMKMELNGKTQEIDVYLTNSGDVYKTTADNDEKERNEVIDAFNLLY